jgi:serralysin
MTISKELFSAILALDSYNRGYSENVNLDPAATRIGNAVLSARSDTELGSAGRNASFFAQAYTLTDSTGVGTLSSGQTIISFRGTDDPAIDDVMNGWTVGFGFPAGSQARLAVQFYESVANRNLFDAPPGGLILTGHSLGGGLAGLIASQNGAQALVYDSMPFSGAAIASVITENVARGLTDIASIFSGSRPQGMVGLPTTGSITSISTTGEVLEYVRAAQPGYVTAIVSAALGIPIGTLAGTYAAAMGTGQTGYTLPSDGGLRSPVDLHSQALLVLLQWASDNNRVDWRHIAPSLWDAAFGDGVVLGKGIGLVQGTTGKTDEGSQMLTQIAYSGLYNGDASNWTLVFGDTGIRAMFDDADQVGRLATTSGVAGYLTNGAVKKALSDILLQYAGLLARNMDTTAANATGVIDVTGNRLLVDFNPERWQVSGGSHADVYGIKSLTNAVSSYVGTNSTGPSSSADVAVATVWNGKTDHITKLVAATTNDTADLKSKEDGGVDPDLPGADQTYGAMLVGGGGDDSLTGERGNDLLVGGAGIDTFDGKGGDCPSSNALRQMAV